jgi:hypothetical protein
MDISMSTLLGTFDCFVKKYWGIDIYILNKEEPAMD